jgi:hypothetical protein
VWLFQRTREGDWENYAFRYCYLQGESAMSSFTVREISSVRAMVAGFCLAVVVAIFFAGNASAACTNSGKSKGCQQVVSVPSNQTYAGLLGSEFATSAEMSCSSGANTTTSGHYLCGGELPAVSMSTQRMTGLFSRRYWEICRIFNQAGSASVSLIPDEVSYGWLDDCSDGDCAAEVRMSFSGPELLTLTAGDADQLNVLLYGRIYDAYGDPFAYDQDIVIERLSLVFGDSSSRKAAGTCDWYTDLSLQDIQIMLMSTDR